MDSFVERNRREAEENRAVSTNSIDLKDKTSTCNWRYDQLDGFGTSNLGLNFASKACNGFEQKSSEEARDPSNSPFISVSVGTKLNAGKHSNCFSFGQLICDFSESER